jgi:peptide deformylase
VVVFLIKLLKIRPFGDPILREATKTVKVFNKTLSETIDLMIDVLKSEKHGAALAANQIGINKSIIVINYQNEKYELINPKIIKTYGIQYEYEGCLSLPKYSGKVKRFYTVTISYLDRKGVDHQVEKSEDIAICFQHEIDHLYGILFIDHMDEEFVINDIDHSKLKVSDLLLLTNAIGKTV